MLQEEQTRRKGSREGRAVLEALRSNLSLLGELAAHYEVAPSNPTAPRRHAHDPFPS